MRKFLVQWVPIFILGMLLAIHGRAIWEHYHPTPIVAHQWNGGIVIASPGPITEKLIDKLVYVKDKAEAKKLLQENADLGVKIDILNEALAESKSHGGGANVVDVDIRRHDGVVTIPAGTLVHFKDWRLDFQSDGTTSQYDLTQKFHILSTTGRDKDGNVRSLFKFYEIGPGDTKTEIPVTLTSVYVDQTVAHWGVSPAIQAGVMVGTSEIGIVRGAVVGFQWLKKGRTTTAEDSVFAALTPVVMVGTTREIGVLPFSFNLGHLKHQPLKDLWVSPYIGTDNPLSKTVKTVGVSVTGTF